MDRQIGTCIYEQAFEDLPNKSMASDLVTGFFYAILAFSNEIAAQDIDHIMLKDIRIQFYGNDRLIFALATKKDADQETAHQFLHGLAHRFSDRYQLVIDKGRLNSTGVFLDFGRDVEAELGRESTSISCLQTQTDKFKQYYENAKKNFTQFKESMIRGTKSCTSTPLQLIRGLGETPKYVRLKEERTANPGTRKSRDDSKKSPEDIF
ncbi:MAG TPA: hypothetical protein VKM55_03995 [Candidatus Lokiarchaeia archaeon]|nr:hypothetical protein [Candidatus Lokiarchaeia archaeon]